MIRQASMGLRRYWREALAAIAPFVLVSPLWNLVYIWAHISMEWVKNVGGLGIGFAYPFFFLPCFAVSAIAGLAFGIVNARRPLRLAWIFGISMFVANGGMELLMAYSGMADSEWYHCLFHVGHVFLPVATTTAWLRLRYLLRPYRQRLRRLVRVRNEDYWR